ncbi:hypothetical protein KGA66_29175, partial [Actinocrinis puniceicyclus]
QARLAEAHREAWIGEIEGLEVSLNGAKQKLALLDTGKSTRTTATNLGMPGFAQIAGRSGTAALPTPAI